MSSELFDKMKAKAEVVIQKDWGLQRKEVTLVSGGAPWADHVAVRLFTDSVCTTDEPFAALHLHLPCALTGKGEKTRAVDSGKYDWKVNPGRTLNALHQTFSTALKRNTLAELDMAKALGATITVSNGFHARNRLVANSQRLIAFTWGDTTAVPKDGGTLNTWNLAKTTYKLHIPLHTL